jgi:heme/copper-type cytochrome/quinol oxidase subunit 2
MKSYAPISIAFLVGAFVISAGLGGVIHTVFLLIGLITLVVLGTLVWSILDKRKADEKPKAVSHENHEKDGA